MWLAKQERKLTQARALPIVYRELQLAKAAYPKAKASPRGRKTKAKSAGAKTTGKKPAKTPTAKGKGTVGRRKKVPRKSK